MISLIKGRPLVVKGLKWAKLALIYPKRHLQCDSMPFFPLAPRFMTFFVRACTEIKILLSFCRSDWPSTGLASSSKISEEASFETGTFYHGEVKFCCRFFFQISEHFCAYLGLHWADHSDLGINGKIISSCRTWVPIMPIFGPRRWHVSEVEKRPTLIMVG